MGNVVSIYPGAGMLDGRCNLDKGRRVKIGQSQEACDAIGQGERCHEFFEEGLRRREKKSQEAENVPWATMVGFGDIASLKSESSGRRPERRSAGEAGPWGSERRVDFSPRTEADNNLRRAKP